MTTQHADIKGNEKVCEYWIAGKNDEKLTNAGNLSTIISFIEIHNDIKAGATGVQVFRS